jgi:hypothetical protein
MHLYASAAIKILPIYLNANYGMQINKRYLWHANKSLGMSTY